MALISALNLTKHFKVLNRSEGLLGSVKDLFSNNYRLVKAVDDISFSINSGEIVGFLGPNGAGKSTTIKMMIGALVPTSGELEVNGFEPHKSRKEYVRNIGIVFGQRSQLWWDIPVIESFKVLKEIYEISDDDYGATMKTFQDMGGFSSLLNTPVRNLSLGQRMLCDILSAFLHKPKVVFLDEPTIGLDVSIKSKIRSLIKDLNKVNGTTVVLTSHDIEDVEILCERIIVIDKGKIIYDGETKSFHKLFGAYRELNIQLFNPKESVHNLIVEIKALCQDPGFITIEERDHGWLRITFNEEEQRISDMLKLILNRIDVSDVKVREVELSSLLKRVYEGAM
jgi:ABC-2 type transport system ATP-binding protein